MSVILTESSSNEYTKKYKCPYCEKRLERNKLISHVERKHDELIPDGYTPTRIVFNSINKKDHGTCIICGNESPWNEDKARYDRLCGNPKCKKDFEYISTMRTKKAHNGKTREDFLNDPEFQKKMLSNRSISGVYKFKDGCKRSYTGSYEHKFLEFMDLYFNVKSEDIETPGPCIEYMYNGKKRMWITDAYYVPYNLVFDIKDGGDNPNNREMKDYREKQIAKENAIKKLNKYNYIRLTNNDFSQLIELMLELKLLLMDNDTYKPIIRINENNNGLAIAQSKDSIVNSQINRKSKPASNQKDHINYLKHKQKNKTNNATDSKDTPSPSKLNEAKRVKGMEFTSDISKIRYKTISKEIISKNKDKDLIVSTFSTGKDKNDSILKSHIERFDREKTKAILESNDIVKEYNDYIEADIKTLMDKSKKDEYTQDLDGIITDQIRKLLNCGIPESEIKKYLTSISNFYYKTDDPQEIKKLLKLRLNYNQRIISLMNDMIKKNYSLLNISKEQADELIASLNKNDNSSNSTIGFIKNQLFENGVQFVKGNGEFIDLSPLGFGTIVFPNKNRFKIYGTSKSIDDEYDRGINQLLQNAMRYDIVVMAHGGDEYGYEQEIDPDKQLFNGNQRDIQGSLGKKSWYIQDVRSPKGGGYFNDMNSFVRKLIKDGYKKIMICSCNPGHYELDKDIMTTRGVIINYQHYSNWMESTDSFEYDSNNELDVQLENMELSLKQYAYDNNVNYYDNQTLYENYMWCNNNSDTISEGILYDAWEAVKKVAMVVISAVVYLFKKIIDVIRTVIYKVRSFISDIKCETRLNMKVNTINISGNKAQIREETIHNSNDIKKISESSYKSLANEISRLQALQIRLTKDLNIYVDKKVKESVNESSIIEALSHQERKALPNNAFGVPSLRKFPIHDKKHVEYAITMFNHVDDEHEKELATNIIKAMKKYDVNVEVTDKNRLYKYLPASLKEEAIYTRKDHNPIFITLMHTGTLMSNVIKAFTRDDFSHACISLNSKLDPLYSFGNKKIKGLDTGMTIQTGSKDPFFKEFKSYYSIYVLYVNDNAYKKIKLRLKDFLDKTDDMKYDILGLFDYVLGIPSENHKKYFCSRFVMELIAQGRTIDKVPSLYSPQDIANVDFISLVNRGSDFYKYDYKITEKHLKEIRNGKYNEDSVIMMEDVSTTMNTMVGLGRYNPDNVYIVNYTKNNMFSSNEDIKKYAISFDKSLSNMMYYDEDENKMKDTTYEEFKDNMKESSTYLYNGYVENFNEYVSNANSDIDLYSQLTNMDFKFHDQIDNDNLFSKIDSIDDDINRIKECFTESFNKLNNKYSLPYIGDIDGMHVKEASFYRDLDGVYVMNENTMIRSKSYKSIDDIPSDVISLISGVI